MPPVSSRSVLSAPRGGLPAQPPAEHGAERERHDAEVEGCPVAELAWKSPHSRALDVQTLGNGQIVSIGILSAEQVSDLKSSSPVTFMEVTRGAKPDLMRDGC